MARRVTTRFAGLLILLGGLWGGVIPFVGPYFHFTLGPDHVWTWTSGRLYLDVLPAAAAVLGGLLLLGAGPWMAGRLGALLALAGGIWFAIGPDISVLWHTGGAQGAGHGSRTVQMLEGLSFHTGLGVLIAAFAAYAVPGLIRARRPVAAAAAADAGVAREERAGVPREERATAEPATEAIPGVGAGTAIAASRRGRTGERRFGGTGRPTAA